MKKVQKKLLVISKVINIPRKGIILLFRNIPKNPPVVCLDNNAIETGGIQHISIYPNPAKELLHIEIADPMDAVFIQIVDVLGRPVYEIEQRTIAHRSKIQIDMSRFQEGMYLVRIAHEKGSYHHPLIVK